MLGLAKPIAMAATARPDEARAFYADTLGLTLQADTPFALVFTCGDAMLRVQKVPTVSPAPFTTLGWQVPDIAATLRDLAARGVICERFEGLAQAPSGIWPAPNGDQVAWFKDPDGNILSLTQFA